MYQRLTQILTAARLIARPQGATIEDLMTGLLISRRSVYRVRDALEELHYPIYLTQDGRKTVFKLNDECDRLR